MFTATKNIAAGVAQEIFRVNPIIPAEIHSQPQPEPEMHITAYCEMCSTEDAGTCAELRAKGWGLHFSQQFCPFHEAMI